MFAYYLHKVSFNYLLPVTNQSETNWMRLSSSSSSWKNYYFWEGRYGKRVPVGWPIAVPQENNPAWFVPASIQDTLALLSYSLAEKLLWSMRAYMYSFHSVGKPGIAQHCWANLPGLSISTKPIGWWLFTSVGAAVSPLSTSIANSMTTSTKTLKSWALWIC